MSNGLKHITQAELADAKLFDDLLDEANHELIAAGGPKKLTEQELAEAAKVIEADKCKHRAEIAKYKAEYKNIQGLEIKSHEATTANN